MGHKISSTKEAKVGEIYKDINGYGYTRVIEQHPDSITFSEWRSTIEECKITSKYYVNTMHSSVSNWELVEPAVQVPAKPGAKSMGIVKGTIIECFISDQKPFKVLGLPEGTTLVVWDCKALDDLSRTLKYEFKGDCPKGESNAKA